MVCEGYLKFSVNLNSLPQRKLQLEGLNEFCFLRSIVQVLNKPRQYRTPWDGHLNEAAAGPSRVQSGDIDAESLCTIDYSKQLKLSTVISDFKPGAPGLVDWTDVGAMESCQCEVLQQPAQAQRSLLCTSEVRSTRRRLNCE